MGGGRQLDVDAHALHLAPHRPHGCNHKYHTYMLHFSNLFCMFILNVDALGSHVAPHRSHGCIKFLQFALRLHGHMLNVNAFALQHIPSFTVVLL